MAAKGLMYPAPPFSGDRAVQQPRACLELLYPRECYRVLQYHLGGLEKVRTGFALRVWLDKHLQSGALGIS